MLLQALIFKSCFAFFELHAWLNKTKLMVRRASLHIYIFIKMLAPIGALFSQKNKTYILYMYAIVSSLVK